MVKTFVKKPVEIRAVQWIGDNFRGDCRFCRSKESSLEWKVWRRKFKYLHPRRQPPY